MLFWALCVLKFVIEAILLSLLVSGFLHGGEIKISRNCEE